MPVVVNKLDASFVGRTTRGARFVGGAVPHALLLCSAKPFPHP